MVEIRNAAGQVIHRRRNLRGLLDHGRRAGIRSACAHPIEDGKGILGVTFGDASGCQVEFASYNVLCWWLRARWSWAGARQIAGGSRF